MSLVRDLRRVAASQTATRPPHQVEHCDLCGSEVSAEHRHLLQIEERQILCSCESCFALRSGDPELRPTGRRIVALPDFQLTDELWAEFRIPIGLAFLFVSSIEERVTAFYPSPAGATESELDLGAWRELVAANPILASLELDGEALIVNRLADPPQFLIAPIDRCYALVGLVKLRWEGINGGSNLREAIAGFLDALRREAA
ncbi:MAG: hypothetical protein JWM06_92 [Actinomycetia bacterium]|nr:hypothetical protein [Actinomycetes bacterium]